MGVGQKVYLLFPKSLKALSFNAYAGYLRWLRKGPNFEEKVSVLESLDRSPHEKVEAYQLARLNELISWSQSSVPYYREVLGNVPIANGCLQSLADLQHIPRLSKADVRVRGRSLHAEGLRLYHGHTSGTTGSPLQLVYDREQLEWNRVVARIVRSRAGLERGDRVAVAFGKQIVHPRRKKPPYWQTNLVEGELWLSTFHLSPHTAPSYFEVLRSFGAVALETYPTVAYILAHLARTRNEKIKLKRVLTTSETLFPFQREIIQEVFGAEVFDYYGLAERVAFAVECSRHEGLHLLEGFGYVEPGPADSGQQPSGLVATGLTNRGMPLLRYEVSDVTTVLTEPCSCGLTSRRLAPVATKFEDIIVTPDGRYVSASILTHPFKPLRGIIRSQIIQEEVSRVTVRLEVTAGFDPQQETQLLEALRDRLGEDMDLAIERWEELPSEPSGKFRWVISRVKGVHQVGKLGQEVRFPSAAPRG